MCVFLELYMLDRIQHPENCSFCFYFYKSKFLGVVAADIQGTGKISEAREGRVSNRDRQ